MDVHTIGGLREEAAAEGRPLKHLVSLRLDDSLATAIRKLFHNRCSMAPCSLGPPLVRSAPQNDLLLLVCRYASLLNIRFWNGVHGLQFKASA